MLRTTCRLSRPAAKVLWVAFPCALFFGASLPAQDPTPTPKKTKTAAVTPAPDFPAETPLALYDGGSVTFGEYRGWLRFARLKDEPDKRSQRLANIAFNEVQAATARALGLHNEPQLKAAVLDYEMRQLHEELRRHLTSKVRIEPGELEREVEARKDNYARPRRVRLRNVLKRFPKDATEEQIAAVRRNVEDLRQQLLDGADFEELASRVSDSQTRFRGGMIGWVYAGQLDATLEDVALALQPGELSPVLATDDGFTLLRCEEVEEAHRPPLAKIRAKIEENLRKEKFAAQWADIEERAAAVDVDLAALASGVETRPVFSWPEGSGKGVAPSKDSTLDSVWTVAEIEAIFKARGIRRPLHKLSAGRLEDLMGDLVEHLVAADTARLLGLDRRFQVAELLHWSEVSTLTSEMERREIEKRFEPMKEEEIRAFYEANKGRYQRPEQTEMAVIRVSADRSNIRQKFEEVEQWVEKIHSGQTSFEDAARQISEHSSAAKGGLLGWLDRQQIGGLSPNVFKTIEKLEAGEVSGLVQQPEGVTGDQSLWVVRVLGTRPAKALTFEEARQRAENGLGNQRTRALQAQIRRELYSQLNLRPAGAGAGDDVP